MKASQWPWGKVQTPWHGIQGDHDLISAQPSNLSSHNYLHSPKTTLFLLSGRVALLAGLQIFAQRLLPLSECPFSLFTWLIPPCFQKPCLLWNFLWPINIGFRVLNLHLHLIPKHCHHPKRNVHSPSPQYIHLTELSVLLGSLFSCLSPRLDHKLLEGREHILWNPQHP